MNILRLGGFLLLLSLSFSAPAKAASQCVDEFNKTTSISGARNIQPPFQNERQYNAAKWAVDFYDRCSTEINKGWSDVIKANRSKIDSAIQAYEDRTAKTKEVLANCPTFKTCQEKLERSDNYWFKGTSAEVTAKQDEVALQHSSMLNVKDAVDFANECSCFIDAKGLRPLADLATSYNTKWNAEADSKKQASDAKEKVRADDAAKRQAAHAQTNARIAAMSSSKECKIASAKQEYCRFLKVSRIAQLHINREKKVGEESGYVNASELRGSGSVKVTADDSALEQKANYKELTGKDIAVSDCQLTDVPPLYVKLPKKLLQDVLSTCGTIDNVGHESDQD